MTTPNWADLSREEAAQIAREEGWSDERIASAQAEHHWTGGFVSHVKDELKDALWRRFCDGRLRLDTRNRYNSDEAS